MIRLQGVTKSFGETCAVDSVDLSVARGEIFGVVGPDGAGKSTLLRMISTILPCDSGTVFMKGKDVSGDPFFVKDRLAYMPQRFGLYEDLTVEENIYFFGRLYGVSRKGIRSRMTRLYEFSRLEPFKDRLAGNLSGGMKQKLGLACCLVHDPELILLDEPTNGVDPVSRREFWKILYNLLADEVTIIVSTAYLDEAERCNRVALMHQGRFIRVGEPKAIRRGVERKLLDMKFSDPRGAELVLRGHRKFSTAARSGESLRLFTHDPAGAKKEISSIMKKKGIGVASMKVTVPGLEDSFMEIISQGGGR